MKENDGVYSLITRLSGLHGVVRGGKLVCAVDPKSCFEHIKKTSPITQYPPNKLVLPMEFFE